MTLSRYPTRRRARAPRVLRRPGVPVKHPGHNIVYQLKITLRDVEPPIWRRVLVTGDTSLGKLHMIIQAAMGWTNSHLHMFSIEGQRYSDPKFELDARDWKERFDDESDWNLFEFEIGKGSRFRYEYDFGDSWEHEIRIEAIRDPAPDDPKLPACIAGARACPPEDVGGIPGYADFLAALADPKHENHAMFVEWIGGSFDPEAFDIKAANKNLQRP